MLENNPNLEVFTLFDGGDIGVIIDTLVKFNKKLKFFYYEGSPGKHFDKLEEGLPLLEEVCLPNATVFLEGRKWQLAQGGSRFGVHHYTASPGGFLPRINKELLPASRCWPIEQPIYRRTPNF